MSAEIIPFDPDAPRRVTRDVQAAWDAYDRAAADFLRLMHDPLSTSNQRRDASLRAIRLHRDFVAVAEAM